MTDTAEVLLQALPYIREFAGRTIVVKYGGAAMTSPALREEFARDIVLLKRVGVNPVVVHGGGPEITSLARRLGLPVEFVNGLRVSDEETVGLAKMVLVGKQNKDIVLRIGRHGHPAVGLCGDDARLFTVRPLGADTGDVGLVGEVCHVEVEVLKHLMPDYIPVIASAGADFEGRSHNVNADEAAAAMAVALDAYKLVFLTDVEGWRAEAEDPSTVIRRADQRRLEDALPGAAGGMAPKLRACARALRAGCTSAHIVDGRRPHSLLLELFTDEGVGTKIFGSPRVVSDAAQAELENFAPALA
jgi:acetylglutamate kinase